MAVYTSLDPEALSAWLAPRRVGELVDCRGIASGIENSNFFVTTVDGGRERHFVLTLFERLGTAQLPYYLSLMGHLAAHGIPCPAPVADRDGRLHAPLAGKPAALVSRLPGRSLERPTAKHCAAIGAVLARMHLAAAYFERNLPNPRGLDWWIATADRVRDFLDDGQRALLDDQVASLHADWRVTQALPTGAIHGDLFRDNALFEDESPNAALEPRLGGIIDFYFAGRDVWLLDLAIAINDWCIDVVSGALDPSRVHAMIDAYDRERTLNADERDALPTVLCAAALRFWLSRLDDFHSPRPAQLLTPHDPTHFERVLRLRRAEAASRRSWFDRAATTRGTTA